MRRKIAEKSKQRGLEPVMAGLTVLSANLNSMKSLKIFVPCLRRTCLFPYFVVCHIEKWVLPSLVVIRLDKELATSQANEIVTLFCCPPT